MKLQFLAIPLLVALMLSPLAAAAAGLITFSSPASGASYSGQGAYTITGTITPTPALPDNVNIVVTQQGQSTPLDVEQVAVQAGGVFSVSTLYGGNSAWVSGTYVISASDSTGASGTTTFTYTSVQTAPSGTVLSVVGRADSILYSGQTAQIFALAYWNNGSAAAKATFTANVLGPTGTASGITWTKSSPASGVALWTATLPAGTADGAYAAVISATEGGITGWTLMSFQVNSQIAPTSALTTLQTSVTAIQTSVTALQTSVTAIQTGITGLQTSITAAQTSITGLQTSLTGLQTSVTAAQTSITAVGKNLTTWGNSITATLSAHTASLAALTSSVSGLTSSLTSLTSSVSGITSTLGTVNSNVAALGTALSALTSTVNTLSTTVGTISSTVSTISTSISSLSSSIQTLTSNVAGVQTTLNGLSGLSGQMTSLSASVSSLSSSVSNEQTYILVVAALAVITLVLELAILIRKMS